MRITTSVPPYAIVAGNPARIIRYRFNQETIKSLVKIAWWNWSDEKITEAVEFLLSTDLDEFIKKYE